MVRRHGSLIQPHYPRRNQYGPIWQGCNAALGNAILESAVGIGQLLGFGIGFTVSVHSDGSDLLLFQRTVHVIGTHLGDGIHNFNTGSHFAKSSILTI